MVFPLKTLGPVGRAIRGLAGGALMAAGLAFGPAAHAA